MYETLQGLNYLHDFGMIHRDVKAGNILYDSTACIKLADFGVSAIVSKQDALRTTMVGTWHWMAPEVIDHTAVRPPRHQKSSSHFLPRSPFCFLYLLIFADPSPRNYLDSCLTETNFHFQKGGYDALADIWSLGITAIELAYGDAPYGDAAPMQVRPLPPSSLT